MSVPPEDSLRFQPVAVTMLDGVRVGPGEVLILRTPKVDGEEFSEGGMIVTLLEALQQIGLDGRCLVVSHDYEFAVVPRWATAAMEDQSQWPEHLRDDAPVQQCSKCHRETVDKNEFGKLCGVPQPDGSKCFGQFQEPREAKSE